MTVRTVEWEIRAPLDGTLMAIVRLIHLGKHEPYYRAVTPEADPSQRTLIGYWASVEAAEAGVFGEFEHATGASLHGGSSKPSYPRVPWKTPPNDAGERGVAARPRAHGALP